jgi:hypothetical protein
LAILPLPRRKEKQSQQSSTSPASLRPAHIILSFDDSAVKQAAVRAGRVLIYEAPFLSEGVE